MNIEVRSQPPSLLRALLPQAVLLTLIVVLYGLSLLGIIPSPRQLNELLVECFTKYGLPLIILSAFLENLVGVNAYFPGAFTILTGMSLTAGHPAQAVKTYLAIYIPSYSANLLSYLIGRCQRATGSEIRTPSTRKNWLWLLLTYWHPQLASVTAFSAGVRNAMPKRIFFTISFFVSLFWSLFWAVIIYHFGLIGNVAGYFSVLFVLYVLIWASVDARKFFKRRR